MLNICPTSNSGHFYFSGKIFDPCNNSSLCASKWKIATMKKYITIILSLCLAAISMAQNPAIVVEKNGKGAPVIFLPGFTCPGKVWNQTIENLKGNNQHFIVSYAGFGGIAPIKMPWYETIKKELIKYIQEQKLQNITIIGHSMGGTLALDIASEIPNLVSKLVVVDGLPCMRDLMMPGVSADQIQYKSAYNEQLLKMNDESFLKNATMFSKSMTNKADKVDILIDWSIKADRETYVYGYTDLLKTDIRPALSKITAQVMVLGASFPAKDMVEKTLNKQFENLPNKTIEVVPDSRHFIFFDQPEWFYNKVNSFISK